MGFTSILVILLIAYMLGLFPWTPLQISLASVPPGAWEWPPWIARGRLPNAGRTSRSS